MTPTIDAMLGATAIGCLFAAVFFARFWFQTRDRFFGWFTVAMVLLAVNWLGVLYIDPASEAHHDVYFVRLLAFLMIGGAIIDKNRTPGP